MLARLNQVVARVTASLEDSDSYTAADVIGDLIDDLTNWYVRRTRRRFWKSEQDSDKKSAYATLYHVLVKLTRLLAPFTPFVTEAMYQNLVRGQRASGARERAPHPLAAGGCRRGRRQLCSKQMALARQVASLGLGARSSANLKVRQPLARAMAYAGNGRDAAVPNWSRS